MRLGEVRWGGALAGALVAEVLQVAAAFGWVAFYSYVIDPGQPIGVYEAHARRSGPLVSIVAGFPIFYAASRWLARSVPTGSAMFGVFLLVDAAILIMTPPPSEGMPLGAIGVSYATKLVACLLGGRHGIRRAGPIAA
jgi:hypothetical protein